MIAVMIDKSSVITSQNRLFLAFTSDQSLASSYHHDK